MKNLIPGGLFSFLVLGSILSGCEPGDTTTAWEADSISYPLLFDIQEVAGKSFGEVKQILGPATLVETAYYGPTYGFRDKTIQIVFVDGKTHRIIVGGLEQYAFSKQAVKLIGLPVREPNVSSRESIRWENYDKLRMVALFNQRSKSLSNTAPGPLTDSVHSIVITTPVSKE